MKANSGTKEPASDDSSKKDSPVLKAMDRLSSKTPPQSKEPTKANKGPIAKALNRLSIKKKPDAAKKDNSSKADPFGKAFDSLKPSATPKEPKPSRLSKAMGRLSAMTLPKPAHSKTKSNESIPALDEPSMELMPPAKGSDRHSPLVDHVPTNDNDSAAAYDASMAVLGDTSDLYGLGPGDEDDNSNDLKGSLSEEVPPKTPTTSKTGPPKTPLVDQLPTTHHPATPSSNDVLGASMAVLGYTSDLYGLGLGDDDDDDNDHIEDHHPPSSFVQHHSDNAPRTPNTKTMVDHLPNSEPNTPFDASMAVLGYNSDHYGLGPGDESDDGQQADDDDFQDESSLSDDDNEEQQAPPVDSNAEESSLGHEAAVATPTTEHSGIVDHLPNTNDPRVSSSALEASMAVLGYTSGLGPGDSDDEGPVAVLDEEQESLSDNDDDKAADTFPEVATPTQPKVVDQFPKAVVSPAPMDESMAVLGYSSDHYGLGPGDSDDEGLGAFAEESPILEKIISPKLPMETPNVVDHLPNTDAITPVALDASMAVLGYSSYGLGPGDSDDEGPV